MVNSLTSDLKANKFLFIFKGLNLTQLRLISYTDVNNPNTKKLKKNISSTTSEHNAMCVVVVKDG